MKFGKLYLQQSMPIKENDENKNIYHESRTSKWTFRIIAVFIIILFCFIVIRTEFNNMKKNEITRESALQMIEQITRSIEATQDAWNTIYYFYQTGNLFKILKCPSTSETKQMKQKNILLRLYDEKITNNNNNANNSLNSDTNTITFDIDKINDNNNRVHCGNRITISIGAKDEIYKHPADYKNYTFILGEEPLEILENYPFVKHALASMKIGERATFIAIPAKQKTALKIEKQTIYEITVHANNENNKNTFPLYFPIRENNEKFVIDNHIVCGSIVSFIYDIYDIDGKKISTNNEINKVKIGSGKLNNNIEQLMLRMSTGDRYKVFITKNMYKKNTEFIPLSMFNGRDAIVFDISIINVQN